MIILKSREEIEKMRCSGQIVAALLEEMKKKVLPGVSTAQLDGFARDFIARFKAIPTFLGYRGYPAAICASVNREVVHGIPSGRVLHEGDIVSIDVGATLDGFVGDAARTYGVGRISPEAGKLLEVTQACLDKGIAEARAGNRLQDIGWAIQNHAESNGFSVVRDYVGHGIGRSMHEAPQVPNFGKKGEGVKLKSGMTLAIEPMINAGGWEVKVLENQWTVVTVDGKLSAHFENTVALTEGEPEILTVLKPL